MQKSLNKAIKKYDVLALVVADPIATVIRCTLENRLVDINACLCGEGNRDAVEIFEVSGFNSHAFVNAEHSNEPVAQESTT